MASSRRSSRSRWVATSRFVSSSTLLLLFGTGLLGLSSQVFELRADAVEKSANFRRLLACLFPRFVSSDVPFEEPLALAFVPGSDGVGLFGKLIVLELEDGRGAP